MEFNLDKKDVYKEVFVILSHFNSEIIEKIPSDIYGKLVDLAADSELNVNIDTNKDLEEQNISEECKSIISLLYYKYIADANEKEELVKIWKENDKK